MKNEFVLSCILSNGEKRRYLIIDTGKPYHEQPQEYSAGTDVAGGIVITCKDTKGYITQCRSFEDVFRFLSLMRIKNFFVEEMGGDT